MIVDFWEGVRHQQLLVSRIDRPEIELLNVRLDQVRKKQMRKQ